MKLAGCYHGPGASGDVILRQVGLSPEMELQTNVGKWHVRHERPRLSPTKEGRMGRCIITEALDSANSLFNFILSSFLSLF